MGASSNVPNFKWFTYRNMTEENFQYLSWNTFHEHLKELMKDMINSSKFTDVTLISDDKKLFKAHKIVLSACSLVFKTIISEIPKESSVIYLRGIEGTELESILQFIYLGEATFCQERTDNFLTAAQSLEIKQIVDNIEFEDNSEEEELVESKPDVSQLETFKDEVSNQSNDSATQESSVTDKSFSSQVYDCNICEKVFSNNNYRKRHMRSIHSDNPSMSNVYTCDLCDKAFKYSSHRKRHIKSIHEGVVFPCSQCGRNFTQKAHLRTHEDSVHNKNKV